MWTHMSTGCATTAGFCESSEPVTPVFVHVAFNVNSSWLNKQDSCPNVLHSLSFMCLISFCFACTQVPYQVMFGAWVTRSNWWWALWIHVSSTCIQAPSALLLFSRPSSSLDCPSSTPTPTLCLTHASLLIHATWITWCAMMHGMCFVSALHG